MPDRSHLAPRTVDRVFRMPNRIVLRAFFDLEIEGVENLPRDGGAVIAANHFSHLDPPLIAINLDRFVRYLAVDELFQESRAFGLLLDFLGTIPLDRGGYPIAAMREAIDYVSDGGVLGVFPEGRRVERWGEDAPKRGAAWLAKMTGAPLVPVAIVGTEHSLAPGESAFRRTAVKIWVEKPLMWTDYEGEPEPMLSMMADWYTAVDGRVQHWS